MNDIGDFNGGAPALKAAAGGALKHFAGGGGVAKKDRRWRRGVGL